MNSIDLDLTAKVVNIGSQFRFGSRNNGPALLKAIIGLVQVATKGNATLFYYESLVLSLPTKVKDFDSIVDFNSYVRYTLQSLENYGRKAERVLPLLFQSFLAVDDEEFVAYIRHLLMQYDHGHPNCIKDEEQLLSAAEEQYKLQILRSN